MVAETNGAAGDPLSSALQHFVFHNNSTVGPVITVQPMSQTAASGDSVTFTVGAQDVVAFGPPLKYQWLLAGTAITGETNASLTVANVKTSQNQNRYSVRATGVLGLSTLSSNAILTVLSSTAKYVYLTGSRQDYTFNSGLTYAINSQVQLYGNTKIEAGTIIKFDTLAQSSLVVKGNLFCASKAYNPAMLTCVDDESLGIDVYVHQTDGSPVMATNGCAYLDLTQAQCLNPSINNLRFSYADKAVTTPSSSGLLDMWDCQFAYCNIGVANSVTNMASADRLHNVLFAGCQSAIQASGSSITISGEQVTADVTTFSDSSHATGAVSVGLALTNSIILGNLGDITASANNNVVVNPSGTVFQSVGAGNYYLAANSQYRKSGTASINSRLVKELCQKSTQPPVAFPAFFNVSTSMKLGQQAERYTNGAPDYGYYYDVLDYTVAYITNSGAITVLPGTVVGFRNEKAIGAWYGFDLREGSSFVGHGTQSKPIIFTDVQWVQEQVEQPCYACCFGKPV